VSTDIIKAFASLNSTKVGCTFSYYGKGKKGEVIPVTVREGP
jgi:hypothetical protein